MSSSSLLPSKYYDKLQVNRLKANAIKSDNISPETPEYLFSLTDKQGLYQNNIITINKDTLDLIVFTDRPLRYQNQVNGKNAKDLIEELFSENTSNSFTEDPPNLTLVTKDGQNAYQVEKFEIINNNQLQFMVSPLRNEISNIVSSDLPEIEGNVTMFIDNILLSLGNLLAPLRAIQKKVRKKIGVTKKDI